MNLLGGFWAKAEFPFWVNPSIRQIHKRDHFLRAPLIDVEGFAFKPSRSLQSSPMDWTRFTLFFVLLKMHARKQSTGTTNSAYAILLKSFVSSITKSCTIARSKRTLASVTIVRSGAAILACE